MQIQPATLSTITVSAVQSDEALAAESTAVVGALGRKNLDSVIVTMADAAAAHQTVINMLDAARIGCYLDPKLMLIAQTQRTRLTRLLS